jgi:hypothetical protein
VLHPRVVAADFNAGGIGPGQRGVADGEVTRGQNLRFGQHRQTHSGGRAPRPVQPHGAVPPQLPNHPKAGGVTGVSHCGRGLRLPQRSVHSAAHALPAPDFRRAADYSPRGIALPHDPRAHGRRVLVGQAGALGKGSACRQTNHNGRQGGVRLQKGDGLFCRRLNAVACAVMEDDGCGGRGCG